MAPWTGQPSIEEGEAFDPQETLGSGRQASGSSLSARRRYGNLRQSQLGPKRLAANGAAQIHRIGYLQCG
jgi:hypothetical protein